MNTDLLETEMWREEIDQLRVKSQHTKNNGNLIAFYGSSSIRLWETMTEDLAPYQVINLGFGGSSYKWCDFYFDQVFEFLHPAKIVLYAGDNDLGSKIPESTILHHAKSVLAKIKSTYGAIPVSIMSVKPSPERLYLKKEIESLNTAFSDLIHNVDKGSYIDVHSAMLDKQGHVRPELFIEDQLHMNTLGYKIWRTVVKNHFDKS